MKKILSVVLSALLLIYIIPLTASADTSGYYTYTVSDGKTEITDVNESISGDVTVPEKLGGYPVTSIGYSAFSGCSSLTSITLPEGVTSIGDYAFSDTAYYNNYKNWDNGVLYIGNYLIDANSEELSGEYSVKEGTTFIADYAFDYCDNLTSIILPEGVTSIGSSAFSGCSSLTSITLPKGVTSIGYSAFEDCSSLTSIIVHKDNKYYSNDECGVLFNKDKTMLIQYPIGNERTSYIIPEGVTSIGDHAFSYCDNLISISIPESVTLIDHFAFGECNSLTSISIPKSVTYIEFFAFAGCNSLASIIVHKDNKYYSSDEYGVLFNKDKTTLIQYPIGNERTSYIIPKGVINIKSMSFLCCYNLTSISIPKGVTHIADGTFEYCKSLTSITIPEGVTSIGTAFDDCENLTDVYFAGTEEQWNKISIEEDNEYLTNATIHFNYHEHSYTSVITAPTCTDKGYTTYTCDCGDSFVDDITDVIDHKDNDGDEFCDYCDEFLGSDEDENNCPHMCHQSGIMAFIWSIINFFGMIFGLNPVCECGAAHY